MPLFSVFHHDNEVALFSAECTTGALNTALMELASGGGNSGNNLQPMPVPISASSSALQGTGATGLPLDAGNKKDPPSVALGSVSPGGSCTAALNMTPVGSAPAEMSPMFRASSAKSKRINLAASLAVSLLEPPTMNLCGGTTSPGDTAPSGWLMSTGGIANNSSAAPEKNGGGSFGASLSHSSVTPFPVYNYHKLELLPLSFVLDLVNNPKVLTALQAAVTQREQLHQALLAAETANSPTHIRSSPVPSPVSTSSPSGHKKNSVSQSPSSIAAVSAAASNANNPSLSALLHNIPFVGLTTMPVHNSILEMCPPNGQYVLLGCREKMRASKTNRHPKSGGSALEEVPSPVTGAVTLPPLHVAGLLQQLPCQPGHLGAEDDLDGPATLFQPVGGADGDAESLPLRSNGVYVLSDCGGHRFGEAGGKRVRKARPNAPDPENDKVLSFAAPTRRPPVIHSAPTAPPPPSAAEVLELVQRGKRVAARVFQRGPLLALGVPTPEALGAAAPGTAGGKEREKEKGHGKHSSSEDAGPHFGPRKLLTTELPPLPPEPMTPMEGGDAPLNAGDGSAEGGPDSHMPEGGGSASDKSKSKGGDSGRGKSGSKEKKDNAKNAVAAAAAAAAAAKDENTPIVEEHTEIPLSGAASALLYNCPHNVSIAMNSGVINVRSVPVPQEDSLAMMLATGVDDAVGAPSAAGGAGSPSAAKGAASAGGAGSAGPGGGPSATGGAKTHILERMEAFDVLWRGSSGEHEVLTWLLQEYLKTMKYKISTAYTQAAGGGASAQTGGSGEKRRKSAKTK